MHPPPRPKSRDCLLRLWPLAAVLVSCGQTTIDINNREHAVDLEAQLVAYLRFDETDAGALALDASGHGHNGTPSPSAPTPNTAVPPVGFENPRSLAFDGVDQLIDLGGPPSLDLSGPITLAAWVRVVDASGYRNIIAHGFRFGPSQEISLRVHDGNYEFTFWTGSDHQATSPMTPGDIDNWHHIAGIYDGQSYKLYRDGSLIGEHADSVVPTQLDAPWAVGGRSETTPPEPRLFSGSIDEVRIYERALNDIEIRALARL